VDFDKAMSDDETFFALWNKDSDKENTTLVVAPNTVESQAQAAAILAKRIYEGMNGEGNENDKVLADIIVFAVKKAFEWQEEDDEEEYDEDEDYKEEECADCSDMRTCNEKKAIAYRKKHHIPRPKKKSNKKIS